MGSKYNLTSNFAFLRKDIAMNNNHRALHETFARHFIGFEPLLRFAENTHEFNFPPHNIERITEDHYRLTLAIAGFAKNEINLSLSSVRRKYSATRI